MATTTRTVPVDLCAIRLALLDPQTGAPLTGANNGYVSNDPQQLEVTVSVEEGASETLRNGCNVLVATLNDPDLINGIAFAMNVTQLDFILEAFMTGGTVLYNGSNQAVGSKLPRIGAEPPAISFEGWAKAWEDDHQMVHPHTSPDPTYLHLVFPLTKWVPGAETYSHALNVRPLTGKGYENPSITANGPFDDWPAEVSNAGGVTEIGGKFLDDSMPTSTNALIPVTSAAS